MTITLPRTFTVDDYTRMRETGIFPEEDRLELLDGVIYSMSPLGPLHITLVNRLNKLLVSMLGDTAIVSVQNAVRLGDLSEPQPDIAILRPYMDDDLTSLAGPADIFLLMEIADTSLAYDRDQKIPRYAEAGIAEVWLIDVTQRIIEQYTQPVQNQYTRIQKYLSGTSIQSSILPQIQLRISALFR